MITQSRAIGFATLTIAAIFWGGLFYAGKGALANLDPFWFTFLRYLCATTLLFIIVASTNKPKWGMLRDNWITLLIFGLLGYGMFGIMVFIGLRISQPSHEAVIMATMPVTTLFFKSIFDKRPPQWWAWGIALLAIFGVSLVSGLWSDGSSITHSTIIGDMIALIGTFGWVMYTRGQMKVPKLTVVEYTAFTAIASLPGLALIAVVATLLGFAHWPTFAHINAAALDLGYIVIFGTVLAGLSYNRGVRTLGPTMGIIFINLVPISALVIGAVLGSPPKWTEMLGTLCVIAALLIQARFMVPPSISVTTSSQLGPRAVVRE